MRELHTIGYEREALYHEILRDVCQKHQDFKSKTLRGIIERVAPEFLEGLFEHRPCSRFLRYIGNQDFDLSENEAEPHEFFKVGEVYKSRLFNGATYFFEGYDKRIGYVYFEVLEDLL